MFKSQFGFAPIASAPPYEAPRGTQVSSSLVQTFLHSCTVHFHSLTQLILLLLTPCSFGQNKRAYHETVSLQTAKNSKIKGRGKNYNSMQLRRMGRNHCADIWTQVSMPPWLALMGLLTQVYKPLPWYPLNGMLMELADWDRTVDSIPLWFTPLDLLSLNFRIKRQISKSWSSWSPRIHCPAEVALQKILLVNS